jgi:hypothetical protein
MRASPLWGACVEAVLLTRDDSDLELEDDSERSRHGEELACLARFSRIGSVEPSNMWELERYGSRRARRVADSARSGRRKSSTRSGRQ